MEEKASTENNYFQHNVCYFICIVNVSHVSVINFRQLQASDERKGAEKGEVGKER